MPVGVIFSRILAAPLEFWFYWAFVLLATLPYPLLYISYRRILVDKRLSIQNLIARHGVVDKYISRFGHVDKQKDPVQKLFDLHYHWRTYFLALTFNVLVVAAAMSAALTRVHIPLGLPGRLETIIQSHAPATIFAGFAGAYILNLFNTLKRYRTGDLSPASLHFGWLHMLLACIIAPLFSKGIAPIAFGIGIFPLRDSLEFARNFAKKRFASYFPTDVPAEKPTLHHLEGMTEVIQRLEEEGITSTAHLAYTDPVKLLIRTNIELVVIVDLIDQSLLYNYVGPKIEQLRPIGIRGSIELAILRDDLERQSRVHKDWAEKVLAHAAAGLQQTPEEIRLLIGTVQENSQVDPDWAEKVLAYATAKLQQAPAETRLLIGTVQERSLMGLDWAEKVLAHVATKLQQTPEETRLLVRTVQEDSQVDLIWSLFGEAFEDDEQPQPQQKEAVAGGTPA